MMTFTKKQKSKLEEEIQRLHGEIAVLDPDTKQYTDCLANLSKLYELKKKDHTISPETLAVIGANLAGIILILGFEQANVITSKAIGFVLRGRV